MHRRFYEFGNRLFGRENSWKRDGKGHFGSRRAASGRRLRCEPLESRQMLAAMLTATGLVGQCFGETDLPQSNLSDGPYTCGLTVTGDGGTADADSAGGDAARAGGASLVTGELKKWHKVTFTFDGPQTNENATPNPFTDYRLNVTFTHSASGKSYLVPGYYAADGNAANTGANSGNKWRAHFAPSEIGQWTWTASFRTGSNVAVSDVTNAGSSAGFFDGDTGSINVADTDKDPDGRDFRGKGLLEYVGGHYLQFAETDEYFLKQGADAPENFLAYEDFDGPFASDGQKDNLVKSWAPHVADWNSGDPTWAGGKGKGIIGAVNYLASEEMNVFSFLTMNIGGDDRNVFPYLNYNERLRIDVSRLDQWEIVFEHADHQGMFLHFKTQETENELLLDSGNLGTQRKLYYRELIARFSHHLALNWNLGEEINNATTAQKQAWAQYFYDHDPYRHHIVIHNGANHYDLLGSASKLTGFSLQTNSPDFSNVHSKVLDYLNRSDAAGKPWAVACDEPGDASHALRPDNDAGNSHTDGRKNGIWGTFMAGGWGNEWYFGYQHAHSDLTCQDFRSRDAFWDYGRYAMDFFNDNDIPFWEMTSNDAISSAANDYGFIKPGEVYVVYLKNGGSTNLDLSGISGTFDVKWFDPRNGGSLQLGTVAQVTGGGSVSLGQAPNNVTQDWAILVTGAGVVAQSPFGGTARTIAHGARIQAEDFDEGGEGLAYHDLSVENTGGEYRPADSVDIQTTSDTGGGFNVGWIANTEYLEYTVDVTGGLYNVHARVASLNADPADIRLLIGDGPEGTNLTELGTFDVESTGAWQNWTTISLGNIDLSAHAGDGKVLRLEMIGSHLNINWIEFEQINQAPSVDAGPDVSIPLSAHYVNLDGTVTDDGLPNPPGAFFTMWTVRSAPSLAIFGDGRAIDTTVTFDAIGVYTFRLAANDGDKQSYDEVRITVTPEPGDANGDGSVNVHDLGILATHYGTSSGAQWGDGDFTGDGKVDEDDLYILADNYGSGSGGGGSQFLPGDANGDNSVDVTDLGILTTNYGTSSGAQWDDGDFNGDGKVNVSDMSILATNYGTSIVDLLNILAARKSQENAMPCDLDNDGQVGPGDLGLFSSVYGEQPGITTQNPYAYAADFDSSGAVDVGDLAIFSSHYRPAPPETSTAPQTSSTAAQTTVRQPRDTAPNTTATGAIPANPQKQAPSDTWALYDFNNDGKLANHNLAILARHWIMNVEEKRNDDNHGRDTLFATVGTAADAYGQFVE